MKKENITIESYTKEFDENTQNMTNLKIKIEKEIEKINKNYDEIFNEVSKAYEKLHEKLINEENNLKEKLQNEVTKIKEKLENFLSKNIQILKNYEKIQKGIKKIEKEEKNINKILSYVSKINKTEKETKFIFQELIKNLKISFQEEQKSIIYDEYYFNGLPIPQDIIFTDITDESFKISWKVQNLKMMDIKIENIKYKVELKKDGENEIFQQVYLDNNNNCLINNLETKTKYKIRICCIYNDLEGKWSENKEIQTALSSIILNESKRENEFVNKIFEWSGYKSMELLYRGSRDGMSIKKFHELCDHRGPTICLFKTEKGYIFGGYSPISWESNESGKWYKLDDSFMFTLTNIYEMQPTKFPHNKGSDSVYHASTHGPTFDDIYFTNDFKSCSIYFPRGHIDTLGKGKSILTGNNDKMELIEVEILKLNK